MPEASSTPTATMKPTLGLTGLTVNAMALIAPGAFLWLTFEEQDGFLRADSATAALMYNQSSSAVGTMNLSAQQIVVQLLLQLSQQGRR